MLNDQLLIKNLKLKNRLIAAPVMAGSADCEAGPTSKTMAIYNGYAEAPVGMAVMEQCAVHPWGRVTTNQFRMYNDRQALALEPVTRLFRSMDIPVAAQLNFGASTSQQALYDDPDFELVTPSGIKSPRTLLNVIPRAIKTGELVMITQSFADAAERAIKISKFSGGVQIYACHGYLLGQFLSPLTNGRTDKYGGPLMNRARLLFEIVEAVKGVIGDNVVSVRLGASDVMPGEAESGLTLAEGVKLAKELAKMGVDWLSVSGNLCAYGPKANDQDTAYFSAYSKAIREAVSKYGVPVDCTGGIRTRRTAEELLQKQLCDLVGIGRPLAADRSFLKDWAL